MPKKTARAKRKPSNGVKKSASSQNRSGIDWKHSHPLYFWLMVAVGIFAIVFVFKLIEINQALEELNPADSDNVAVPMMQHTAPTPSTVNGY